MRELLKKKAVELISSHKPAYLPLARLNESLRSIKIYDFIGFSEVWAAEITQKLPPNELEKLLVRKILSLFKYSIKNVPYWQRTLKENTSISKLSDIEAIPILTKDIIKQDPDSFISKSADIKNAFRLTTSGSTGSPFSFLVDKDLFYQRAFAVRYAIKSFGHDPRSRLYRLSYQDFPWANFQGKHFSLFKFQKNPGALLHSIKQYQPDAFYGTVSHLLLLAQTMDENRFSYPVKFAVSRSEHLIGENKKYLEKIFGCEVFNIYASREFGPLGQTCRQANGLHINPDKFIIEIVDNKGKTIKEGGTGEIIVTSLHARIMPLIRYDTDDTGRWINGNCGCGINTKKIALEGRSAHMIHLNNGKKFPLLQIINYITLPDIIKNFQFVQENPNGLIIKVIPDKNFTDAALKKAGFEIETRVSSPGFKIIFKKTDNLELLPNGKNKIFSSSVKI